MAAIVELQEGDALVIRMPTDEPPTEAMTESMELLIASCGLAGIIYLAPGENLNIARLSDDELAAVGLQRIPT